MRYFGRDNKYRRLLRLQQRFPRFWRAHVDPRVWQIAYPPIGDRAAFARTFAEVFGSEIS